MFDSKPISGALYVENKFEIESLILNTGVRFDFLHLGESVDSKEFRTVWENATGLEADWKLTKMKFSPRFGLSFPITEYMVLFFSYGHFLQTPELQYYYRDPYSGVLLVILTLITNKQFFMNLVLRISLMKIFRLMLRRITKIYLIKLKH